MKTVEIFVLILFFVALLAFAGRTLSTYVEAGKSLQQRAEKLKKSQDLYLLRLKHPAMVTREDEAKMEELAIDLGEALTDQ